MSSGASSESRLSGAGAEAARNAALYLLEQGRARSRGEAVSPLPAAASGLSSGMASALASALAGERRSTPQAPVFKVPPCQTPGRRVLAARYRAWWSRNLTTPYGLCACGCGGLTPRAGWTSRQRGFVSGEPLAFLPHHRKRYGYPTLTDPGRRCACGCGRRTPVVRDTAVDEAGVAYQFCGMRARYLNADHRPPPGLPGLALTTPLGAPGEAGLSKEERAWLAGVLEAHLSFARDRGKLRPKIQSTDGELVQEFLQVSGRGRVDVSQPGREGASVVWKWTGRCSLEAANLLTELFVLLEPETKESARKFFEEMEFPAPDLSSPDR